MHCCASCFGDRGLREDIIPIFEETVGTCSYCGTENESLVAPADLRDYFESLISIYSPSDEGGKTLVEWFKDDWGVFTHQSMDIAHAKELLADILDDGQIVREDFVPSDLCQSDGLAIWEKLRNELMYENRFFPQTEVDEDKLEGLLYHLTLDSGEVQTQWYRARIQQSNIVYAIDKMGAPPKRLASQGRANPAGIPYLYLASTPNTAISEIRPHTGEYASVADFVVSSDLKLADLRDPVRSVSPFTLSDEQEIALLRGDIEFLVRLGSELTRPVLPHAVAIDYIPSQYLCELIKRFGYHGVVYNSSVGDGINLALFNPATAEPGEVVRYQVTRVSVDVEP
jgi:hypothetical protein